MFSASLSDLGLQSTNGIETDNEPIQLDELQPSSHHPHAISLPVSLTTSSRGDAEPASATLAPLPVRSGHQCNWLSHSLSPCLPAATVPPTGYQDGWWPLTGRLQASDVGLCRGILTMPLQLKLLLAGRLALGLFLVCLLISQYAAVLNTPPAAMIKAWLWSQPTATVSTIALRLACTQQLAEAQASRGMSDLAPSSRESWPSRCLAPGSGSKGERFLLFEGPGEQLTKGRLHLAEAMALARTLNRTLVLPPMRSSSMSFNILWPLPACTYFDVHRMAEYVPWVTVEEFESRLGCTHTPLSVNLLILGQDSTCRKPFGELLGMTKAMLLRPLLVGLLQPAQAHECVPEGKRFMPSGDASSASGGQQETVALLEVGRQMNDADVLVMVKQSFAMFLPSSALEVRRALPACQCLHAKPCRAQELHY